MPQIPYPSTRTVAQADDYHGTRVEDPYRWLEDTDAPETVAWVAAQNELTFDYLAEIPARDVLKRRLTELWDHPRQLPPERRGGRYFQRRNSGLQSQDVLYTFDSLEAEARVLLDPNGLSADGTVALSHWSVSKDGRLLAYATAASGSDWPTWRVREVDSGQDLPDLVEWSKFSGATWLPDSSGFYYAAYDAPEPGRAFTGANYFQKIYLHRLGQPQAQDELIYHRPDQRDWVFHVELSDDDRYLVLHAGQGTDTRNRLFYQDVTTRGEFVALVPDLEASFEFVGNDGPRFYLHTDLDAPRGRLIAVDVTRPEREHWQTLVTEGDDTLQAVKLVNDQFVLQYLHQAHNILALRARDGSPAGSIALPTLGSVTVDGNPALSGQREDSALFYVFHSFVHPMTVFRYDFAEGRSQALFSPPINFDFGAYETRQEFAVSKEGTRVPMFIVQRRGAARDGQNPTLLYGYGGFNRAQTPVFQVGRLAWLEMGGALVVANIRGGAEYGEAWHRAGSLLEKQNTFDDFIACAEYLIAEGVTSTPKLAIEGRSNGGLLVGACLTQRPDLFGAALAHVGVMDMLRFHRFTIGWAWTADYGSAEDPEQFKVLRGYSPLHNLRPGTHYPPTLITTADHDDRVVPGHSFKFAAALQAAQGGPAPVLIRIQTAAGHGPGKPTAVQIAEVADVWGFLVAALGMGVCTTALDNLYLPRR